MINNPIINAEGFEIYTVPETKTQGVITWLRDLGLNNDNTKCYVLIDKPTESTELFVIQPFKRTSDNLYAHTIALTYKENFDAFCETVPYGGDAAKMVKGKRYAIIPILQEVQNDI